MASTPQDAAAAWASRLASSTDKIKKGIESVSVAPGAAAARQKSAWVQNTTTAADKWAANVASVSLQDWQQAAINKGVNRIASGAQASQGKFEAFMGDLLPHIDRVKQGLPARGNLDQNINRMVAFSKGMAAFKRR